MERWQFFMSSIVSYWTHIDLRTCQKAKTCQKFIRQAFHMDHYGNHFGQREKETMGHENEVCLHLSLLVCSGVESS